MTARVLVVDDLLPNIKLLEARLTAEYFDVLTSTNGPEAIEACKAIDCYEYQSCEHPGWRDSGAKAFCERLRSALIGAMHGYEEAEWHWDTELAMARAPRPFRLDLRI